MFRRLSFAMLFITVGFLSGLVLTGHLRSAEETAAAQAPSAAGTSPMAGRQPATASVPAALPDLTGVAQLAASTVTDTSSTQIVRA